jgi:hypothetical protein
MASKATKAEVSKMMMASKGKGPAAATKYEQQSATNQKRAADINQILTGDVGRLKRGEQSRSGAPTKEAAASEGARYKQLANSYAAQGSARSGVVAKAKGGSAALGNHGVSGGRTKSYVDSLGRNYAKGRAITDKS